VRDYQRISGNRWVYLLRHKEGDRVHFLLISLWDSHEAIKKYRGKDIGKAKYFPYDLECLLDPEPNMQHYDVLVASGAGKT